MKKALFFGALGLAMVVAGMMRAGAAGPSAAKIGYIDLQSTLKETKVGKAARDNLEAEKTKRQKTVDVQKEELKAMYKELEKQRVVLKPDAVSKKEQELQEKYVALQQKFMESQQELSKKEATLTKDIFDKASKIIDNIAKRDGYTMILEKSESAVLWADPTLNITAEVNKRLDAGEGAQ